MKKLKKVKDFPKELQILEKKFKKFEYQGISVWPSISQSLYIFYLRSRVKEYGGFFYKIIRIISFLLFYEKIIFDKTKKGKIIASYIGTKNGRKSELFYKTLGAFDKKELEFVTVANALSTFKINSLFKKFSLNLLAFKTFFKVRDFFKDEKLKDIFHKKIDYFYFLMMICYECKRIDYLKSFLDEIKPSGYIAMTPAANKIEAVLTELCNSKRIKTFSLQQGIYANHKKFNLDLLIYYNSLSDYYFVWGENSKKELSKYINPQKIIIAGNPKYFGIPQKKYKIFIPKSCGIFLNQELFKKSNLRILSKFLTFAKKNPKIKFIVKPHPTWDLKKFSAKNKIPKNMVIANKDQNIKETLSKVDVVIAHNSTLLMEALSYGIPIFRFKDKDSINFPEVENCFSTISELENLFKKYSKKEKYSQLMKKENRRYLSTFYQPKVISIPEYYKKKIIEKIKNG